MVITKPRQRRTLKRQRLKINLSLQMYFIYHFPLHYAFFFKKIQKNTRPLYDACRTTLTSLESIYRAILDINMPNEDLFLGLNQYTMYFLFLREAYTNAPIYFILFLSSRLKG